VAQTANNGARVARNDRSAVALLHGTNVGRPAVTCLCCPGLRRALWQALGTALMYLPAAFSGFRNYVFLFALPRAYKKERLNCELAL
jgi:hypothetical protein